MNSKASQSTQITWPEINRGVSYTYILSTIFSTIYIPLILPTQCQSAFSFLKASPPRRSSYAWWAGSCSLEYWAVVVLLLLSVVDRPEVVGLLNSPPALVSQSQSSSAIILIYTMSKILFRLASQTFMLQLGKKYGTMCSCMLITVYLL